ncbi:carbamoyl-phosphate synthase L chain, ATP binding domain-domain-containing protein [Microdochium bolleyi]|uniref:Carbamoyl-phosphate synthase L chain, ATP binding domain-domain-containing protein n=1 Tax=Microdochium bolleyi TaxID=196109 RepID=A0A136JEP0_9PEZI|nr:carbamoyl-phosphate synthase L chain, ATP binding domain-domain-containing protein [Microdochium bolleyi]
MLPDRPPPRPIKRLLVANRGEIAVRVLAAARELGICAIAAYTKGDATHVIHASEAIELPSPASYLDIDHFVKLAKDANIDAVHPGYGFLSESAEFTSRMWEEAGVVVVGPGWAVLDRTGDKLMARKLAVECHVPVCPALQTPTNSLEDVQAFANRIGYPIMIKAVDGGGGRGIRLVRQPAGLENLLRRAIQESPSRQVFCEKAAVDGFRHVEVQIVGDGSGQAAHLWERECSIQRKYQKIVELAPSTLSDRALVNRVIQSAVAMAEKINYFSLGTFEFLVNPTTHEFFFLEINPRLQVEHTVTESICSLDIVAIQLHIAQGATLSQLGLVRHHKGSTDEPLSTSMTLPNLYSIQFRLTAENIEPSGPRAGSTNNEAESSLANDDANWTLSIGKIQTARFPTGNGIRVDTHIVPGYDTLVSSEFDSVIAKIIVTAPSWEGVVRKAQRALGETHVAGVKTNLDILRAIACSEDFRLGRCDTRWLEANQGQLVAEGSNLTAGLLGQAAQSGVGAALGAGYGSHGVVSSSSSSSSGSTNMINATLLFRKGDAWSITLLPGDTKDKKNPTAANGAAPGPTHHLELSRVLRNEFPTSMSAEIILSDASTSGSTSTPYTMHLSSTSSSSAAALSQRRRGSPGDARHVIAPFSGKLMEILVDEGDYVKAGDVVCVIRQMKMELEVRSSRAGKVGWVCEAEDGEDIGEGTLICEIELEGGHEKGDDGGCPGAAKPRL